MYRPVPQRVTLCPWSQELRRLKGDAEVLLKVSEENGKLTKQLDSATKENKGMSLRRCVRNGDNP